MVRVTRSVQNIRQKEQNGNISTSATFHKSISNTRNGGKRLRILNFPCDDLLKDHLYHHTCTYCSRYEIAYNSKQEYNKNSLKAICTRNSNKDFEMPLRYLPKENICGITSKVNRWETHPEGNDRSLSINIDHIRNIETNIKRSVLNLDPQEEINKASQTKNDTKVTKRTKTNSKWKIYLNFRLTWNVIFMFVILSLFEGQVYGDHPRACAFSIPTLLTVNQCPRTKSQWQERARMKSCHSVHQNCTSAGLFQYHCLLDGKGTSLVEVCAPVYQIIGRLCAEYNVDGMIIQNRPSAPCGTFDEPCSFNYKSNTSYQYQGCYAYVKSEYQQTTVSSETSQLFRLTETPSKGHETLNIQPINETSQNKTKEISDTTILNTNTDRYAAISISIVILAILVFAVVAFVLRRGRRKMICDMRQKDILENGSTSEEAIEEIISSSKTNDGRRKTICCMRQKRILENGSTSEEAIEEVTPLSKTNEEIKEIFCCMRRHSLEDTSTSQEAIEETMAKTKKTQEQLSEYNEEAISILYLALLSEEYCVDLANMRQFELFCTLLENLSETPVANDKMFAFTSTKNSKNVKQMALVKNNKIMLSSKSTRDEVFLNYIDDVGNFIKDDKMEFFLSTASLTAVKEYCRSEKYTKKEGEICICLPEKYTDLFITKMNLNIVSHCSVEDEIIHPKISQLLAIPSNILLLDEKSRMQSQRKLAEAAVYCFHALGMLIGTSEAEKTTLLRKLTNERYVTEMLEAHAADDSSQVETFEVFEAKKCLKRLKNHTLEYFCHLGCMDGTDLRNSVKADVHLKTQQLPEMKELNYSNAQRKILSLRVCSREKYPFGCLEIYLSKHSLPILIMDLSKDLESKICDQSVAYNNWTCLEYYTFCLNMIYENCGPSASVVVLGTHYYGQRMQDSQVYKTLHRHLPRKLQVLLNNSKLTIEVDENNIPEIERSIIPVITPLDCWGKEVPLKWMHFEKTISHIRKKRKVANISDLQSFWFGEKSDMKRALQFFSDIRLVLYFDELPLTNLVVLDIDWFCEVFHYIIANSRTFSPKCNHQLQQHSIVVSDVMDGIWESSELRSACRKKETVLLFMQRLGLLFKGKGFYYIPSLNTNRFGEKEKEYIKAAIEKTPVMTSHFDILPASFFPRMVVLLSSKFDLHKDYNIPVYQNAAFYCFQNHQIVLGVHKTDINLQIFTEEQTLENNILSEIRSVIHSAMNETIQLFLREKISYEKGLCPNLSSVCDGCDNMIFANQMEIDDMQANPLQQLKSVNENMLKFWLEDDDIYSDTTEKYEKRENQVASTTFFCFGSISKMGKRVRKLWQPAKEKVTNKDLENRDEI